MQAWTRQSESDTAAAAGRAQQWQPGPACGPRAGGPGYQSPSEVEGLAEAAGLGAGCYRDGNICMHLSVSLPQPVSKAN